MPRKPGKPVNGELIKKSREKRAWTQEKLAESTGLSLRKIQALEAGGTGEPETIKAIERVLHLTTTQLLFEPPTPILAKERLSEFTVEYIGKGEWPIPDGSRAQPVVTDNLTRVKCKIHYDERSPRGRDVMQYRTSPNGWVGNLQSNPTTRNLTARSLQHQHDGTRFHHEYEVEPGLSLSFEYQILGAFDSGNRDFHTHLCQIPNGMIVESVVYRLDLSSYGKMSWTKIKEPVMYYSREDSACDGKCLRRTPSNRVKPQKAEKWSWEWGIGPVSGGVVELDWNEVLMPPA